MTTGQLGAFTAIAILSIMCLTGSAIMFTMFGKAIAKKETTEEIVPAVFLMIIGIGLIFVDVRIYINAFYQSIQ